MKGRYSGCTMNVYSTIPRYNRLANIPRRRIKPQAILELNRPNMPQRYLKTDFMRSIGKRNGLSVMKRMPGRVTDLVQIDGGHIHRL